MSASPDSDRSLNADQPVTVPAPATASDGADLKIPPLTHPAMTLAPGTPDLSAAAGETNAPPDLSLLTRGELEAQVKTLSDSITSANTEAEYFRQQWQDLRLRDEALGVELLTVDERKLTDKEVQAVGELYKSEMKRREAMQLLEKLLSTTGDLLQTAPNYDPKVRADYEVATRAAKEYLSGRSGASIPIGATLSDGQISDVNPQLNAVIVNLGKNQGVKEGMPFLIFQDDKQVATVKIVLARDLVSAALVQNLQPNVVLKIGDRVAVDATP